MTDEKKKDEEQERSPKLMARYHKRLSTLKLAHEYAQRDNIVKAVEGFSSYLRILADYHQITEPKLDPSIFDQEKEVPEMLIISQVYWGLAKAYDRNPNLHNESRRCLAQFIKFSIGYKYQYLNSEMIRKFLRRKVAYQPKAFQKAYEDIQIDSKKCFVASYCFTQDHHIVENLRSFKRRIAHTRFGRRFIFTYYRFSPPFVNFLERHPLLGKVARSILRPIIRGISFLVDNDNHT